MAFDEPLTFGLLEDWDIEVRLVDPAGEAIDPDAVEAAWLAFTIPGGAEALRVEADSVVTVGEGADAYTSASFNISPAERLDEDDALLFGRRPYEHRAWVVLLDGTVHDQNAGYLTVT